MEQKALDIQHLTKKYGNHVAVDNISFSVEKGEFFGFLGPNGAGKSTTIHCITGIARIQEGTILVDGHDVTHDFRRARQCIGFSPQEFNVDIFSIVYDILDFVGGYYGMPKSKRKQRINELVEQFELEDYVKKPFRTLSGGLKRRVMLARAMIHDPELLILDEPTAGVDVELRHELWNYLRKINKEGKTIVLTSHYLEEVELLCNRIAIINKGKIVKIGDKAELIHNGKKLESVYLSIIKNHNHEN